MGFFVLFSVLRTDALFLMDAATGILDVLKDENVLVRSKGSWALGNLSNALNNSVAAISDNDDEIAGDQAPAAAVLALGRAPARW